MSLGIEIRKRRNSKKRFYSDKLGTHVPLGRSRTWVVSNDSGAIQEKESGNEPITYRGQSLLWGATLVGVYRSFGNLSAVSKPIFLMERWP